MDPNIRDKHGDTALMEIIGTDRRMTTAIETLLTHPNIDVNLQYRNYNDTTVLIYAIQK